jgi:hypothetical protein
MALRSGLDLSAKAKPIFQAFSVMGELQDAAIL